MSWGAHKSLVSLTLLGAALGIVPAVSRQVSEAESAAARPGSVLRGNLTGGIWVELAHDGQNYAELAILDGLPGGPPQTQFIPLSADRSGGSCILRAQDGAATVSPCPGYGSYTAGISISAMSGSAVFQEVGWEGSFAWGATTAPVSDVRARCSIPGLSRTTYLQNTAFSAAVSKLAQTAQSLPSQSANAQAELERLRTDRLKAYASIILSAEEAARAKQVDDAVAGRSVSGRPVPLPEATRQKADFDREVVNHPQRVRAREELLQIDRSLSGIYDVAVGNRRLAGLTSLRQSDLPMALTTLDQALGSGLPGSVADLISLEAAAGELDTCAQALGLPASGLARQSVRDAMTRRAGDIASSIRLAVNTSSGSVAARSALQAFESNAAVREALEKGGQASVLEDARGKILQIASAEEKARIAAEKQAALEAERDRLPPTTSRPGFDYERVERAVMFISNYKAKTRGSGFIVAPGYVVTNSHVVGSSKEVDVIPNNAGYEDGLPATVIAKDNRRDLALLSVPGLKGKVLALASVDPPISGAVYALGFPGVADHLFSDSQIVYGDMQASVTDGIVSRVVDGDAGLAKGMGLSHLVQHTADIAPGNSGGALVDGCHRVVGVNSLFTLDSDRRTTQEVAFAVSSLEVLDFLKASGVTPQADSSKCK